MAGNDSDNLITQKIEQANDIFQASMQKMREIKKKQNDLISSLFRKADELKIEQIREALKKL